ncbi:MAG: dihydroxyacetone kinase phosphoryl donor subunit DhaM [Maledivibacter sp.]|jgi:dihydroxyacetone kinase phosphotransfer subunit|nr:dihydroxyacetone kinase phosphoryl donor subunit DhaM [Maledivibacter sp.]
MIGMVIVSHSEKIAKGIVELCSQMADKVKIEAAGGSEDGRIGTNATKIMEAIEKVYSEEGVLVLVDLGSAIMSTELAFDLLEDNMGKRIVIADAPIVEGSIAASIQASIGGSLEEVKTAAEKSKNLTKI